MKKHINIPFFVPQEGCKNACVFCSQDKITGLDSGFKKRETEELDSTVESFLSGAPLDAKVEIAFFGGSFTGIGEERMTRLLKSAYKYIENGRVSSLRCSTRPDYIDEKVLKLLDKYGMKNIELGVQSMDNAVLEKCARGHTAQITEKAAALIRENGFNFIGQMMIGLPGATGETEAATARAIAAMGAVEARIYPIVVIRGTKLYEMMESGEYELPKLEETVARAAECLKIFLENGVKVLRIGLQDGEEIRSEAGYHSAAGELIWNKYYYDKIIKLLSSEPQNRYIRKTLILTVPQGAVSKVAGQHGGCKKKLIEKYGFYKIKFKETDELDEGGLSIELEDSVITRR